MSKVFISYSRGSLEVVQSLADDLNAASHEPWFDQELTGGQLWWDSILDRIRGCDVFAAAVSQESLASQACNRELSYAQKLCKPILPVLVANDTNPGELPSALAQIHCVDYRRQDKQAALALVRALGRLKSAPPLPTTLPDAPEVPISYVVELQERITSEKPLNFDDQIALVFRLKDHFREGRPVKEVANLLQRLRKRHDLFAKVSSEIEAVLTEIKRGRASSSNKGRKEDTTLVTRAEVRSPDTSKAIHIRLNNAMEDCTRITRRIVSNGEKWIFQIDDLNRVSLHFDSTAKPPALSAKAEIRDYMTASRSEELKKLGWKVDDSGFTKGAVGGAALWFTGGIAALGLLSKSVRDAFMSNIATRQWQVSKDSTLDAAVAEFILALQRIAPRTETIIARQEIEVAPVAP